MRSGTGQDERRRRGGGRGEGGGREGGQADIKSNNPHLTGGEKHRLTNLGKLLPKPEVCQAFGRDFPYNPLRKFPKNLTPTGPTFHGPPKPQCLIALQLAT